MAKWFNVWLSCYLSWLIISSGCVIPCPISFSFNSVKCFIKQEARFVCGNQASISWQHLQDRKQCALRSSRENILLDGMGADLSRPVMPSESRLRSCDVSDVIVIIGINMCHVAWSLSHKILRMSCAVWIIISMHLLMNTFGKPEPCSARHVMKYSSQTFYILWWFHIKACERETKNTLSLMLTRNECVVLWFSLCSGGCSWPRLSFGLLQ